MKPSTFNIQHRTLNGAATPGTASLRRHRSLAGLVILYVAFCILNCSANPWQPYNPASCVPYAIDSAYCRVEYQWALKNTGQPSLAYQSGLSFPALDEPGGWADLNLPTSACRDYRADDIVIGVIDTGYDPHPDMEGVVIGGIRIDDRNQIYDGNYFDYDTYGHGTGIASIIAANDNDIGIKGVAQGAKLLIVQIRLFGETQVSEITKGIVWCVDNGAHVINLSWGETLQANADLLAACHYAQAQGVIIVSAVGYGQNLDQNPSYPYGWNLPNYLAVAGTTRTDTIYGPASTGSRVVGAPGRVIIMANPDNGGYWYDSGSSFAAPMVSGVLAMLLQNGNGASGEQWVSALKLSAALHPIAGIIGRIDAAAALEML